MHLIIVALIVVCLFLAMTIVAPFAVEFLRVVCIVAVLGGLLAVLVTSQWNWMAILGVAISLAPSVIVLWPDKGAR